MSVLLEGRRSTARGGGRAGASPDAGAALREEGERLRARAAAARQASSALVGVVTARCAASAATCEAVAHVRDQWRSWREGLAALRRRAEAAPRRVLRVCMECEAVCFTPAAADDAATVWVAPPGPIREQFRAGWRGPVLSHGVCPQCAPRFEAALSRELAAEPARPEQASARGDPLRAAFAEVAAAAAALIARTPGTSGRVALDRALALVVARLAAQLPPAELQTLAGALQAFVPPPAAAAPNGRTGRGWRLRPPLRLA